MRTYRIGEIAELTGVSVAALRFYEARGLLQAPPRSGGGYRRYAPGAVRRVRFIRQAQALGLSLDQVHELLREHRGRAACRRVHDLLLRRLADVDQQMSELRRLRRSLAMRRRSCAQALGCAGEPACPTLQRLEVDGDEAH